MSGAVVVLFLSLVLVLPWWKGRGDPTAATVRDVVQDVVGDRCPSGIEVRGVKSIGGPGLPLQMRAAREIVCKAGADAPESDDETGHPGRLAVYFVFPSDTAAREWMSGPDYQSGQWWLHHGTLVAAVDVADAEWRRVRAALRKRVLQ